MCGGVRGELALRGTRMKKLVRNASLGHPARYGGGGMFFIVNDARARPSCPPPPVRVGKSTRSRRRQIICPRRIRKPCCCYLNSHSQPRWVFGSDKILARKLRTTCAWHQYASSARCCAVSVVTGSTAVGRSVGRLPGGTSRSFSCRSDWKRQNARRLPGARRVLPPALATNRSVRGDGGQHAARPYDRVRRGGETNSPRLVDGGRIVHETRQ